MDLLDELVVMCVGEVQFLLKLFDSFLQSGRVRLRRHGSEDTLAGLVHGRKFAPV